MRLRRALLLAAGLFGCRQPNPDWSGPNTEGMADGTSSAASAATESETAPQPCTQDLDCTAPQRCGPRGCQNGDEGDPCDDDEDCAFSSSICGPRATCQDGNEGDPCENDDHCQSEMSCNDIDDQCHDGSPGDPCANPGDCPPGVGCKDNMCEA